MFAGTLAADPMLQDFEFDRFRIKGVEVAALDLSRVCDLIGPFASSAKGAYITVTGAHGIVESSYDERVLAAHQQAFMSVPDGMPLVWLGRLLGFRSMGRVYGPDLMQYIFSKQEYRQLRHFFYGSNPSTISNLQQVLVSRFGEFNLVGSHCPPMRPIGFREDDEVLLRIRGVWPDIIWVGLSTPKQELWMQMHMPMLGCGVAIGVGAAFDLLSGKTVQAPRWIQRSGFEWLFRLVVEPRRLFRRYLFVVPRFLFFLVQALLQQCRQCRRTRLRSVA